MGIPCDDVVVIQPGKTPDEPSVLTLNCPDKAGLGCDLCRIILQFGLSITKADFSTDGRWCYIVLWVVPHHQSLKVDWESLKDRLSSACPSSCFFSFYVNQISDVPTPSPVYLLKFWCHNQRGSLHDVTKVLCELEIVIQRVKVMPTPDGRVLDLFFITDCLELLHTKQRRDDICEHLMAALGEYCITCELKLPGPEYEGLQGNSSLPPALADELFSYQLKDEEAYPKALTRNMRTVKKTSITVDNSLSPVHTVLQIQCVDRKALFYDIMRTSKDCNIQVLFQDVLKFCCLKIWAASRGGATVGSMGSHDPLEAMEITLEVPWSCWCDPLELLVRPLRAAHHVFDEMSERRKRLRLQVEEEGTENSSHGCRCTAPSVAE